MNVTALSIAAVAGATFLAAEMGYERYYRPDHINLDMVWSRLRPEHSKARVAVSRMLIYPSTASFDGLRSVEVEAARYVCGSVKAMDREHQYAEVAFVYTVAIDLARVDDEGHITSQHSAYKPCPVPEEEKIAQQKVLISPGTLTMVRNVEKVVPKSDPSALSTLTALASGGPAAASAGTMENQLGQLAGQQPGAMAGAQSSSGKSSGSAHLQSTLYASPADEFEWRDDRPPAAWPAFPPEHPLAKPAARKRTVAQALAFAKDVESRCERAKSPGHAIRSPSSDEIKEACRALLAIDPKDKDYAKAWTMFVRLRKIDREAFG